MDHVWIWYLILAASSLSIFCYKIAALNKDLELPISNFYKKHTWHIWFSVIIYIVTFISAFEEINGYLVFFLGIPLSTVFGMAIIMLFKGRAQLIAPILIFIALGAMIYLHTDVIPIQDEQKQKVSTEVIAIQALPLLENETKKQLDGFKG